MKSKESGENLRAEFDFLADSYHEQHKKNIEITGESPEYFARYKISDLHKYVNDTKSASTNIFDFGCGIGNSIEYFREFFPHSELCYGDVSMRSLEIAKARFPGTEKYIQIGSRIPLPTDSQDIVFTACVFHHIPADQHHDWLLELKRIVRPGGILAIYEHNPLNPITVRAVNTCPFDVNARLIRGGTIKLRAKNAGWVIESLRYKLFFPSYLRFLRAIEPYLSRLFLGAQWRLIARKK